MHEPPESGSAPRVFVSSVVEGFSEFREAARAGIIAAGGEPVLVNEDFPSLIDSSRNACLDAVDSCDFLVSIISARGGWTAPSGMLVIEEEYRRARLRQIPVLVFLREERRDADAERFARELSDYIDGAFRRTFTTTSELRDSIERALTPLLSGSSRPRMNRRLLQDYLATPLRLPYATTVRLAIAPERDDEVVDPVCMESESFRDIVYGVGHSSGVRLLSYRCPKDAEVRDHSLVILQTEANGRHGEGEHVRLEISEAGDVVVDANVTGRVARGAPHDRLGSMIVALEDVESMIGTAFRFVLALYDELDRFKRHQRFRYNIGLSGLEHRTLERNPKPRSSYTMSMRSPEAVIVAFDEPRLVDRSTLLHPGPEIERAVVLLARRAADQSRA